MTSTHSIPEQGQLVDVRGRRYAVTDVEKSTLAPSILATNGWEPQHLVSLASVEDDALGEELQVIWELEPGAKTFDGGALPAPQGFDPPDRLDAFLNAVRWGAVSTADGRALQAPFRSGIEIEDYQLDPLVRAVQMPRVNLLIADEAHNIAPLARLAQIPSEIEHETATIYNRFADLKPRLFPVAVTFLIPRRLS